jgi:hypothetical protein
MQNNRTHDSYKEKKGKVEAVSPREVLIKGLDDILHPGKRASISVLEERYMRYFNTGLEIKRAFVYQHISDDSPREYRVDIPPTWGCMEEEKAIARVVNHYRSAGWDCRLDREVREGGGQYEMLIFSCKDEMHQELERERILKVKLMRKK